MSAWRLACLGLCCSGCALPSAAPRAVLAAEAPAPIGPYSQAIARGEFVFVSGQIGLCSSSGELAGGGIVPETTQAIANLRAVLAADGLGLEDVVLVHAYLVDLSEFAAFNQVYAEAFHAPAPARATVGVQALPKGARVELQCTAMRP